MIRIPLIYAPEGSTIMLDHRKYIITYKGKYGATLSIDSQTSLPMPMQYRRFPAKYLESDQDNPFIYCELIKVPDRFSVEEFISLHPEYFI